MGPTPAIQFRGLALRCRVGSFARYGTVSPANEDFSPRFRNFRPPRWHPHLGQELQPHESPPNAAGAPAPQADSDITLGSLTSGGLRLVVFHRLPPRQHTLMHDAQDQNTFGVFAIKDNVPSMLHSPKAGSDVVASPSKSR